MPTGTMSASSKTHEFERGDRGDDGIAAGREAVDLDRGAKQREVHARADTVPQRAHPHIDHGIGAAGDRLGPQAIERIVPALGMAFRPAPAIGEPAGARDGGDRADAVRAHDEQLGGRHGGDPGAPAGGGIGEAAGDELGQAAILQRDFPGGIAGVMVVADRARILPHRRSSVRPGRHARRHSSPVAMKAKSRQRSTGLCWRAGDLVPGCG